MIQPVISHPEAANFGRVENLVEFCRKLDGTEVKVVPISRAVDEEFCRNHPHNQFYSLQAYSLHLEALAMQGEPFIHLEPDSIPLKAGWAQAISDEYERMKKPYLWATDSHPRGDLYGGIGVYGPDTATEIPYEFEVASWDKWMADNIPEKIARTPLIQHKYGLYDAQGISKVRDLSFPLDWPIVRPEAVLFHRDPSQSLIRRGDYRFVHSGCIGDAIAALATVKQLGGGHFVLTQKFNPRILRGERYEYLRPLIESQPYIKSVSWEEEAQGDIDFCKFRDTYVRDKDLAGTQARYIGLHNLSTDPWLNVEPSLQSRGKIVVAKTSRYHNPAFPWCDLAEDFGGKFLFVGLPEEHAALERYLNRKIDYAPTANALETAKLIRGAAAFIGNQSSAFWMAIGMGQNTVQETCVWTHDSIIPRANAAYFKDLPDCNEVYNVIENAFKP